MVRGLQFSLSLTTDDEKNIDFEKQKYKPVWNSVGLQHKFDHWASYKEFKQMSFILTYLEDTPPFFSLFWIYAY